jgi:hypothetical protein
MLGMMTIAPALAGLLIPVINPVAKVFGFDPSALAGILIANDMGGAALADSIASDALLGAFHGLCVASMLGATISFTIPVALQSAKKENHDDVLLGLLCGICTIPVGCFISGVVMGISPLTVLINLLPALLISIIIELATKSEEKKTISIISRIVTCAITVILAFEINSDGKERRYYEFTSPDGQHSVVAEERTYLLAGSVELYERVNPLFMERKEYYSTDDGYRPISNGDYSVAWQDNVMTITMQDGNGNYETINIYT